MTERKIEKEFIIDHINGRTYREVAALTNLTFNTNYCDSERVRDIVRKHNRKEINKKINQLIVDKKYEPISNLRNGVLDLADLHIPFQLDNVIDIVKKHKDVVSAIVLSGDILDCFEISKFVSLYEFPIEEELIAALNFVKEIKTIVGNEVKIILIYGNHEKRWHKYIARMQQRKLYKFLNPKVLSMLKDGFTIYENDTSTHYEGIPDLIVLDSWFVNIQNELIICHPNNYLRPDISNAKKAIEHFITEGEQFRAVVVSHTHHQNETADYLGKCGIELGCLCKPFDYADGYTSRRKTINGYGLFMFDRNGRFDRNASQVYSIETNFTKKVNTVFVF
jgi:hypothetical protein